VEWATLGGRTVVVKTATGRHRGRLRREAAVLGAVAGWPATELVACEEGETTTTLITVAAGTALGGIHAHAAHLDAGEVPGPSAPSQADAWQVAVSACRAVAALHASGWAHGSLGADHLLVGPRRHRRSVRCCSLSAAVSVGDPAHARAVAADRVAVLDVVDGLLTAPPAAPDPRSGWGRRRRLAAARRELQRWPRSTADPGSLPDLDELADRIERACTPRPTSTWRRRRDRSERQHRRVRRGPSVAERTAPRRAGAGIHRRRDSGRGRPRRARRATPSGTAAVLALAVAVGLGVGPAAAGTASDDPAPQGIRPGSASPAGTTGCPAPSADRPDVDADGCGDRVEVDGRRITVAGTTFLIGEPGDRPAVGDWDCDGTATVAVLRPATGELFEFDRWAAPSDPVVVSPAATVAGARSLQVERRSACPRLLVERSDGTTAVPLGPKPPDGP
jgi:hypothetical protein